MGMGEPLDNYQQVLRFLELVSSDEGMNIGMRHISVSTCGIVDKIYDMANRKLQCTLYLFHSMLQMITFVRKRCPLIKSGELRSC